MRALGGGAGGAGGATQRAGSECTVSFSFKCPPLLDGRGPWIRRPGPNAYNTLPPVPLSSPSAVPPEALPASSGWSRGRLFLDVDQTYFTLIRCYRLHCPHRPAWCRRSTYIMDTSYKWGESGGRDLVAFYLLVLVNAVCSQSVAIARF